MLINNVIQFYKNNRTSTRLLKKLVFDEGSITFLEDGTKRFQSARQIENIFENLWTSG